MILPGESLPPYLRIDMPLETEQVPLQVMLLTGELRRQREVMAALAILVHQLATLLAPPNDSGFPS